MATAFATNAIPGKVAAAILPHVKVVNDVLNVVMADDATPFVLEPVYITSLALKYRQFTFIRGGLIAEYPVNVRVNDDALTPVNANDPTDVAAAQFNSLPAEFTGIVITTRLPPPPPEEPEGPEAHTRS